ncbi:transposase [Acaryochloris sp. IP29b_bin.137]|uniref:transposase n=1 Tax=Acaryochloris sp. IP29b_bin.137 TaxID=2969217 RepID=UPI00344C7D00
MNSDHRNQPLTTLNVRPLRHEGQNYNLGAISVRVLTSELGDRSQFANERQLFSYTRLPPSEHSREQSICKSRITQQGNRHLRAIWIEIA